MLTIAATLLSCVTLFPFIAFLRCHCLLLLHSHDLHRILLCNCCNCNSFLEVSSVLLYLADRSFMYVAIVSIRMFLPVNNISKFGGEYKITKKGWLNMSHIHALEEYLNLYNNYQHVLIAFVIIIRLALQEY